jgi:hypothetical protein
MTDEEFERLKEAEKAHLREKKRLQRQLAALKARRETEGLVARMKRGAERLLAETESLVEALRGVDAGRAARLDVALDEAGEAPEDPSAPAEARREERATALLRHYKAAEGEAPASDEPDDDAAAPPDGPEKTIGRMRPRADDAPEEDE